MLSLENIGSGLSDNQELFDLAENGFLVADEGQMIVARQFDKLRARDVFGQVTAFFDV